MQKTLSHIKGQYTKGTITAEEATQRAISTITYFDYSFPGLNEWCKISNEAINDFNNDVTIIVACLALHSDGNIVFIGNETITKGQAMARLVSAYKQREETFKTLWNMINKS